VFKQPYHFSDHAPCHKALSHLHSGVLVRSELGGPDMEFS